MPLTISTDRGQTVVDPATLPAGTVFGVYGSVPLLYQRALSALSVSAANQLSFASVTGISAGMNVSGTGIAGGATVSAVNSTAKTVTLSANVTATVASGATITFSKAVVTTAQTTAGTNLAVPTAGLSTGMTVTGTNIAGGTTVAAIVDANNVTLSQAVSGTVASSATITFSRAVNTSAATTTTSTSPLGFQVVHTKPDGLLGTGYQNVRGALVYNRKTTTFTALARAVSRGLALVPMDNITPAAPTYL